MVVDFSTLLPGPLATLILAEAGARVVKVERPGGEEMRAYAPRFGRESAMFALLNRGKESLVADLKDERARASVLARSAATARTGRSATGPATTSTISAMPASCRSLMARPRRPSCRRRWSPISAGAATRP
jgi:hypothetical protein